jgi:hypothetical protein
MIAKVVTESFTDGKQRVATKEETEANWSGGENGIYFRCHLCGHKFKIGDKWRFVSGVEVGLYNFLVCEACDGEDVRQRWVKMTNKFEAMKSGKYWWFLKEER